MDLNALVAHFSEQQVAAFMLVLGRVSPLFLLAPLFSSKQVPARARGILAIALTIGLMPAAARHGKIDLDTLPYAALMVKEILVGLAFAYGLSALFAAVQAAGSLLDTLIGFSFGSLIDPVTGNQSTVISNMYALFGAAVFVAIDGDAYVIQGLARTYDSVPLLKSPEIGSLVQGAQAAFSGIFIAAFEIAAPVLVALIITDAAFGVVSRVVPQLNIFSTGFPAKMIIGLTLIGVSLPFVSGFIGDQLETTVVTALHTIRIA
jgi:flagellar biosynthesis protein FliR